MPHDRMISEAEVAAALTHAIVANDDAAASEAWASVPVPIRIALANVGMAAEGKRVSTLALSENGRVSRSVLTRRESPWKDLLGAILDRPHALYQLLLEEDERSVKSSTELEAALAAKQVEIEELRAEVAALRAAVAPIAEVANAALDGLAEVRGRQQKALASVRNLRPV